MTVTRHEIRQGAYYDSVVLMQLQRSLVQLDEVEDAGVVMATQANRDVLTAAGFSLEGIEAKPDDLLIVVKSATEEQALAAIGKVDELLKSRRTTSTADFRPRSLDSAAKNLPEADWLLVSVPGRYAAGVADEALDLGKHVFLYSDNVSIQDEVKLKQKASQLGLMVMGPDCGTAIINGVGLGFANHVNRGKIGLVGASGTGLQAITSAVHNLGGGVSQAIGTGGRDLKADVGGITALQGLELLGRDTETEIIVLVSKPPSPSVASKLLGAASSTGKHVVVNFIGYPVSIEQVGNIHFASSLQGAAKIAVSLLGQKTSQPAAPLKGYLRGLFSGGTLAYETLQSLHAFLSPMYSNIPITPDQKLPDSMHSQGHVILDLGEDEFTQGRLHPMMDNDLRIRRMWQEARDPETGIILLDVVLGEGAHPDPASELVPAIKEIKAEHPVEFAALVIGTSEDPQDMGSQIAQLEQAGVQVFQEIASMADYLVTRLSTPYTFEGKPLDLSQFRDQFAAINVGLESFYDSIKSQGYEAVQVDWRPPAGGKEDLMAILAKMKKA
jgi:FdrA protein